MPVFGFVVESGFDVLSVGLWCGTSVFPLTRAVVVAGAVAAAVAVEAGAISGGFVSALSTGGGTCGAAIDGSLGGTGAVAAVRALGVGTVGDGDLKKTYAPIPAPASSKNPSAVAATTGAPSFCGAPACDELAQVLTV